MRGRQCLACAREDRIDRAGRDPRGKELFGQLHHIAAGDAVAHRQRHDRSLQAGAERAARHLGRQLATRRATAPRAAHVLAAMLDHPDRDRRQLFDLVTRRLTRGLALVDREDVAAGAALGPVLDHLIHRAGGQQIAPAALVAALGTLRAPRAVLASRGRLAGSIGARRSGGVARVAIQPALELLDPLVLAGHALLQPLDLSVHAQEHLDDDLAPRVIDGLRLSAVHALGFDAPGLCPLTN